VDPGKKIRFFPVKFPKNFDYFREFYKTISIFQGKFPKNFDRQFLQAKISE